MTGFSWAQQLKKAEIMKLRREHRKALNGNPDFRRDHPDEWREAQQGKWTMLDKRVKEKLKKHTETAIIRRNRRVSG